MLLYTKINLLVSKHTAKSRKKSNESVAKVRCKKAKKIQEFII